MDGISPPVATGKKPRTGLKLKGVTNPSATTGVATGKKPRTGLKRTVRLGQAGQAVATGKKPRTGLKQDSLSALKHNSDRRDREETQNGIETVCS